MPWLNRLAAGNSPLSPCFDRRSDRVGFMVDEFVVGHEVLRITSLSPVSVIPSMLHTPVHLHVALTKHKLREPRNLPKNNGFFRNRGALDRYVPYL